MRICFSAEIHHGKQQVAEFGFECGVPRIGTRYAMRVELRVVLRDLRLNFGEFLANLFGGTLRIRSVEADTRRAFLQPMRAMQRGEA